MRKIRKRILAVALAAVMLVHIPGTASYAEQAAGDVETTLEMAASAEMAASVEVTASAETEPEEDGSEGIPETAADTGNGLETDAEKPEKEETAPSEGERKDCDCVTLCTEDSINGDCPICGAEGADLSACRGEEQNNVPDNDKEDGTDTAQCICGIVCTEDSINGDCPVCGAEGADLSVCEGTAYEGGEKEEETTEAAEPEEAETEDTNLCAHHKEHTEDCGFVPATEDSEGSPCTYACRICPIEDLIAALPDEVTADNAEDVRARLDEILALYTELDEEEQEQIDLSRCMELQETLDEANTPMPLVTGDFVLSENNIVKLTAEDCGDNCQGHTITQGSLSPMQIATILVESGSHNITFSNLNLTNANVGVMPGGRMNLTLTGENTIKTNNKAGIYVPVDATLIIGGSGSLDVSGGISGAGIGGALEDPDGRDGVSSCGTVEINGGTIKATGGEAAAGIGGGEGGNGGTVTINGGNVTAKAGGDGAYGVPGIGGGYGEDGMGRTGSLTLSSTDVLADTVLGSGGTYTINGDPTADMIVVPEGLVYSGEPLNLNGKIYIDVTKTSTEYLFGQNFTVKASADGWVLQDLDEVVNAGTYTATFAKDGKTISKKFTVAQSGTEFDGKLIVRNGETETTEFTVSDTITVIATPKATGQAPANGAMLAADLATPTGDQMALYVNNTQVSAPAVAGPDGSDTMTVRAADVLALGQVEPNGNSIALTAKFIGDGNMADAAGTVNITITAVAQVEMLNGTTTYVADLTAAFRNAGAGTIVTLLDDVTLTEAVNITVSGCTLDLNGHTISNQQGNCISTYGGRDLTIQDSAGNGKVISMDSIAVAVSENGDLRLKGGSFITENDNCASVEVRGGSVTVTGESVYVNRLGANNGANNVYGDSTLSLSGGTYDAIFIYYSDKTFADILVDGYAYYGTDGKPLVREGLGETVSNGKRLTSPVTVKECKHEASVRAYVHVPDTATHSMTCLACGKVWDAEDCNYEYQSTGADEHTATCSQCGYVATEAHTLALSASSEDFTLIVTAECSACNYTAEYSRGILESLGNLVYGKIGMAALGISFDLQSGVSPSYIIYRVDDDPTETMALSPDLSAGDHTLYAVMAFKDSSGKPVNLDPVSIPINVAKKPITAIVTAENKTYDGNTGATVKAEVNSSDLVDNDSITITGVTGTFADGNAGTGKTVHIDSSAASVSGTGAENYAVSYPVTVTADISPIEVKLTFNDQEITYGDTPAPAIADPAAAKIVYSYTGTASGTGWPTDAGIYTVTAKVDDTGNYVAAAATATLVIRMAEGNLTVPETEITKKFGDGQFPLNCSTNGDGKISYKSSDEDVASVSEDGTVMIKGAGKTTVTVSLGEGTNYTGGAEQEIRLKVAKADAPAKITETRNYTYLNGSGRPVTIDIAGKLPGDCGKTEYTYTKEDTEGILSEVSVDADGNLVYTVQGNKKIGDTASITVTAEMANYETTTFTVKIVLVKKKTVEPQAGSNVSADGVFIYGQRLSELKLADVVFVEQGTGKKVEGTLTWKDGSLVPDVKTTAAEWIFTPVNSSEYAEMTGTVPITVVKATPDVEIPVAETIIYNPSGKLGSVALSGGSATWIVGGSTKTVEGTWGWQSADTVPTVDNSGYAVIFTPKDTANYETVTRTLTVQVTKAAPYIADPPKASEITYGDALGASALSGGTVQYGDGKGQAGSGTGSGQAVQGTFTWKTPAARPTVADSDSTEYEVLFTPADTVNYETALCSVKLTVKKAPHAPNMPGSAMDVPNSREKVGDVPLPEGWEWQESDRETALEVGVSVTATAVYTGADKDSYEVTEVKVTITRSSCDHTPGNILYTGTGEKAPTCTESGLGHRECTKCGSVTESGIAVDALGHTGGTATCSKRKVCTRCGEAYGVTDGSRHGDTEVRGFVAAACTAGGYTGDAYCRDCGAKTGSGTATPALGHDYRSEVTKEPTTGSEGTRTYTCTRCGDRYTESIPKLPEETHRHSYTESVVKQPACTEAGIRSYTCSCGDSYTETIAALGHHYLGSETKKPTTTTEGIMTYTCTRCGHSYTRAIAKLPGEERPDEPDNSGTDGPGNGSTEENRPDTGLPFIKGEDGKNGWDVIRAEEEMAKDGDTIHIDMNGSTVVPGDIFDSIKGRDITITFDMGDGILWSVDGKSITTDKAGDIDFSVKTGVSAIPVDIINNVTGESYSIQISLAYEGEFGFTAVLSIGLGKENAGYTASLYYYNKNTGELEFICKDTVAQDGTVSLSFTHASDYVIAIDGDEEESGDTTEPAQPETPDGDSDGAAEKSPQTGQAWRPLWFIVIGVLVVIMGTGVFFVMRRKKEDE